MNWLNTILILLAVFLAVFLQATFSGIRNLVGAQIDLLPGLVVYTSLSGGLGTLAAVAIGGGLWVDSLSANPLGISILPLFLVGLMIQKYQRLILRDQTYAQVLLGFGASAAVPALTLLVLLNTGKQPLIGWFSIWQWIMMSLSGAAVTPLWFRFFDHLMGALSYRPLGETSFRADREIKRGRM